MEAVQSEHYVHFFDFIHIMVKRNFMGPGEKWVSLTNKTTTKNPETAIHSAL